MNLNFYTRINIYLYVYENQLQQKRISYKYNARLLQNDITILFDDKIVDSCILPLDTDDVKKKINDIEQNITYEL